MKRNEWTERFEALAERVARIERRLNLTPEQPTPPTVDAPVVVMPIADAPPVLDAPASTVASAESSPAQGWGEQFELTVGTRWLAWVGAIVVLLAVGFFLQVAYEQGWLGALPAEAKCGMVAVFGAVLLSAGEWALRRVNRAAAVGLYAAGLGSLYFAAYATFGAYALVGEHVGFGLLAIVVAIGFALTWRGRMLTIGVLSLFGGYGAPLLMQTPPTSPMALPAYLSGLFAAGLALASLRPTTFLRLRETTLACHVLLTCGWLSEVGAGQFALSLSFAALWWTMLTTALLIVATRGAGGASGAVLSLLGTFGLIVMGGWLIDGAVADPRFGLALLTLATAGASGGAALAFTAGAQTLRAPTRTPLSLLSIALWVQVGVLMTAGVGLYVDDVGRVLGWLALALACVELGRRLPSAGVQWFGLLVGGLAVYWAFAYHLHAPGLRDMLYAVGDLRITEAGALLGLLLLATHVAAWRVRVGGLFAPTLLAVLANLMWLLWCVTQTHDLTTTFVALLGPLALLALKRWGRYQHFVAQAAWVLGFVTLKWIVIDNWADHAMASERLAERMPWLNFELGAGLLIAGVWAWLARALQVAPPRLGRRIQPVALWLGRASAAGAGAVVLIGLTFQIRHALVAQAAAQPAGWQPVWPPAQALWLWATLLWALGGLTMAALGRAWRQRGLLAGGWTYLVLATLVWIVVDTACWRHDARPAAVWPVFNLQALVGLGVGAALAAVAVMFARMQPSATWRDPRGALQRSLAGVGAIIFWCGSFEIDRYFQTVGGGGAAMAEQAALSVWWAIFACGLVALGFAYRQRIMRLVGLVLLAGVVAKVLVVDLAEVRYLYRVLSLLATGLLLLATSVAYNRLAGRLLQRE